MSALRTTFILSVLLLLAQLAPTNAHEGRPSHSCVHDDLDIILEHVEVPHAKDSDGRMLSTYSDIRIYFDTSSIENLDANAIAYIKTYLIPPAKSYFESTLKVVPLISNLAFPGYSSVCSSTIALPSYLQNGGVAADLVIMVTAFSDPSSNYLAYASTCFLATDTHRPILGNLNYNLAFISPSTNNAEIEGDILVTMHELTHALGFSSSLYKYYINPSTGALLTSPKRTKTVNGNTITVLTLDVLTAKVRSYFGCSTATGAYIESQGGSASAGSHWERRVFNNEYMTASAIKDLRVSEFTLALFEGTGWYQVDYSMADAMTWGKGKGCSFLDTTCINTSTKLPKFDEFCTLGQKGCSWTGRAFSTCNYGTSSSLSSSMNYWSNNTATWDPYADNCPTYQTYSNKDCEDSDYQYATTLPSDEFYGLGSKCFTGTLNVYPSYMGSTWGYCFKPRCYQDSSSNYVVEIAVGGNTVTCTSKSQVSVPGFGGYLQCPDPVDFCGRVMSEGTCRRGCMGRGTCLNNACVCDSGYTGNDCSYTIDTIPTTNPNSGSSNSGGGGSSTITTQVSGATKRNDSNSSTTTIIAIAGGVGGVVLVASIFLFIKRKAIIEKIQSLRGGKPRWQQPKRYVISPPKSAIINSSEMRLKSYQLSPQKINQQSPEKTPKTPHRTDRSQWSPASPFQVSPQPKSSNRALRNPNPYKPQTAPPKRPRMNQYYE